MFDGEDSVFLKVSLMKEVMWFGKKRKLSPRYVSPYMVLKRVGNIAHKLELLYILSSIHQVFHVSILRKCIDDPPSIVHLEVLGISDSLPDKEISVEILDQQVCILRTKDVALVMVLW